MIEFISIYPVSIINNIKFTDEIKQSLDLAFQLKGVVVTFLENIELCVDIIVVSPFAEQNTIYPASELSQAGFYKLSFSDKINELKNVLELYKSIDGLVVKQSGVDHWVYWTKMIRSLGIFLRILPLRFLIKIK